MEYPLLFVFFTYGSFIYEHLLSFFAGRSNETLFEGILLKLQNTLKI